jgi:rare lipoprotein A
MVRAMSRPTRGPLALLFVAAFSLLVLEGCATAGAVAAAASPAEPRLTKSSKKKKSKRAAAALAEARARKAAAVEADGIDESDERDEQELFDALAEAAARGVGDDDEPSLSAVLIAEGAASFYHDSLAGRRTANGERYQPEASTCAHRSLPFGTLLLVEDLHTGRKVQCRVNDRGPFIAGRIVDLSRRSARELGILKKGVARVRIRVAPEPATS